jgi:hypothetical protein
LALVIFQAEQPFFAQASLNCDPPTYASQVTRMTDVHHVQFFSWDGVNFSAWASLKLQYSWSPTPRLQLLCLATLVSLNINLLTRTWKFW